MKWLTTCVLVGFAVSGGGGVTSQSGISQFWTDDYKVFDHIYGKTSDRYLYGATVPPSVGYGGVAKPGNLEAAEKKERLNYEDDDTSASGTNLDPGYNANYDTSYTDQRDQHPKSYSFDDSNFAALVAKQQLFKPLEKEAAKPTRPAFQFLKYGDFKPISQSNDPETYNYLKHLEALEKQQVIGFPQDGLRGFKPAAGYVAPVAKPGYSAAQKVYGASSPDNADAYKSIQDILNAHEAKKSRLKSPGKDNVKYINYGASRKKPSVRLIQGNDISKSYTRCGSNSGRCRKRAPSSLPRVRQVIRKIKIINNDDD